MDHDFSLILTFVGGLAAALLFGLIARKLHLSPLVGYLLAGVVVGPYSPGFVADSHTVEQFAELGVILLMFGVGLHFHLKDLIAVQKVAVPGAVVQISVATVLGVLVGWMFGWSAISGLVFGMAISVASTVVLTRVLEDNQNLHTPGGHVALGWLVVEDLFTILLLVLIPAVMEARQSGAGDWGGILSELGWMFVKLALLVALTLFAGKKVIPLVLRYVARTGARDLFTLAVLVIALGVAVYSAEFFGASMVLGAFLAGMVVGQSDFCARAAAEAMLMRDAFAVLFFVSVGMMFDPMSVGDCWPLALATLGVVMIGKPLAAYVVVRCLRRPVPLALSVSVALAQVGEFSFILAGIGLMYNILPPDANQAIILAAVVSISLNPILYRQIGPAVKWLQKRGIGLADPGGVNSMALPAPDARRVVLVGFGPTGRILKRILNDNGVEVIIVEMNIDTVTAIREQGGDIVYGDASQREILRHAGIEYAESLILSASIPDAKEIVGVALELNPHIDVMIHTKYMRDVDILKEAGASQVFSSESEVALSMAEYFLREGGADDEQIVSERQRIRADARSFRCGPFIIVGSALSGQRFPCPEWKPFLLPEFGTCFYGNPATVIQFLFCLDGLRMTVTRPRWCSAFSIWFSSCEAIWWHSRIVREASTEHTQVKVGKLASLVRSSLRILRMFLCCWRMRFTFRRTSSGETCSAMAPVSMSRQSGSMRQITFSGLSSCRMESLKASTTW